MVSLTNSAALSGSVCAPSAGSGIMPSIKPSACRSDAVRRSACAASAALARIAIDDGGAALRRNHTVVGVFEHVDAVRDAQAQRASAAAFADHDRDHRHAQPRHLAQVHSRSLRPGRAPRRRCPDRRPAYPETSRWAAGICRPFASGASPCDSPPASAFRNCDAASAWCRGPSPARSPSPGRPSKSAKPPITAAIVAKETIAVQLRKIQ